MTRTPHRRLVGVTGLLLTPLVAWAASFLGGWVGALVGSGLPGDEAALTVMLLGSVVAASAATFVWFRLVSRFRTKRVEKDPRL